MRRMRQGLGFRDQGLVFIDAVTRVHTHTHRDRKQKHILMHIELDKNLIQLRKDVVRANNTETATKITYEPPKNPDKPVQERKPRH